MPIRWRATPERGAETPLDPEMSYGEAGGRRGAERRSLRPNSPHLNQHVVNKRDRAKRVGAEPAECDEAVRLRVRCELRAPVAERHVGRHASPSGRREDPAERVVLPPRREVERVDGRGAEQGRRIGHGEHLPGPQGHEIVSLQGAGRTGCRPTPQRPALSLPTCPPMFV